MRTFTFSDEIFLPLPREELFPFFADAFNLERITPPWMHFEVLTPAPIAMGEGTRIDYRLRWGVIPLRWQSEITAWEPPARFVDEQRRGPYRLWIHEHRLEPADGGTRMHDTVTYAVPGGLLAQRLVVGRDVERIFAYRRTVLADLFNQARPDDKETT